MTLRRRIAALSVTALMFAGLGAIVTAPSAEAHGTAQKPGSRTWLCWQDGIDSTGAINPINPACKAAVAISGPNSLYNWFSVLRGDAAGRTTGYIADGNLCSGGNTGNNGGFDFRGYDLMRNDWPVTHLTSGANFNFEYSNWAHHPGTFYFYVTKDGFSPTQTLKWSDLEEQPFLSVTNPPAQGGPGTNDGHYYWSGRLPSGKSGRHIIYSRWVRSDSQENFFACSDVVFDGGNGQVTGIKDPTGGTGNNNTTTTTTTTRSTTTTTTTSQQQTTTTTTTTTRPTTTTTTTSRPTTTTTTTSNGGGGACSVSTKLVSSWPGGYQVEVNVTAGSSAIRGWTVNLALASGQSISQLWSGELSVSGSTATVKNVSWNGGLSAGGSATFGYLGSGEATAPSGTCTAS